MNYSKIIIFKKLTLPIHINSMTSSVISYRDVVNLGRSLGHSLSPN